MKTSNDYRQFTDPQKQLLKEIKKIMIISTPKDFYSQKEAEGLLGMGRSQLHRLVKQGRLDQRHVDTKVFYTGYSITALVMGEEFAKRKYSIPVNERASV